MKNFAFHFVFLSVCTNFAPRFNEFGGAAPLRLLRVNCLSRQYSLAAGVAENIPMESEPGNAGVENRTY